MWQFENAAVGTQRRTARPHTIDFAIWKLRWLYSLAEVEECSVWRYPAVPLLFAGEEKEVRLKEECDNLKMRRSVRDEGVSDCQI